MLVDLLLAAEIVLSKFLQTLTKKVDKNPKILLELRYGKHDIEVVNKGHKQELEIPKLFSSSCTNLE